jgi:3-hydroxyisobutyrate dehydrogenase-like beta-hydroxyacid dehydrogenase
MAMTTATQRMVAILGSGEMGSAVATAFARAGYRVVTDLSGRSARSRGLAARAGVVDLGSLAAVVQQAELVLSIVPPAAAYRCAEEVAAAMRAVRSAPAFADCNAVAPATVRRIARVFESTRRSPERSHGSSLGTPAESSSAAPFIDAGIVGRAPKPGGERTRFYVSGAARRALLDVAVAVAEIEVVDMGEEIGAASALKMAYAALNKGTDALHTAVLLAAARLGVLPALLEECEASQADALARMKARVPFLASTAARFTGEMAEIASTFAAAGVTPDFHRGAEWVYARLASTPLAAETRETSPRERSLDAALAVFSAALEGGSPRDGAR